MDALQKLEAWIASEKANYENTKLSMTPDERLEAINRQLILIEFEGHIRHCKEEETQEFMDANFPSKTLCEEIKHNAVNDGITTTNEPPAEYSLLSGEQLEKYKGK